jgi:peptidoglycan/xylan/chitin deacetylase (PgdA/CDA1 family)
VSSETQLPMANPRLQPEHWSRTAWTETFGAERPTLLSERWPDGVRVAVLLTFDTQGDVDAAIPGYQLNTCYWAEGKINFCDLTQRQYDTRCGVYRILEILRRYQIKATFPVTGLTAEWYPEVVDAIAADGHEIATHGYRHVPLFRLDRDEERQEIEAATRAVATTSGRTPAGWRSPMYSTTPNTIELLAEAGYVWNSDFHNDDLPYLLETGGRTMVEIPAGLDDWELSLIQVPESVTMGGVPYSSPRHVTDILVSQFNMLYQESVNAPRIMQYCMHPKITGQPYRSWGLQQVIEHMRSHEGVWFCSMEELAALCL